MNRGVLMAALGPHPAGSFEPAMAGAEGYTDADVMLRVRRGTSPLSTFWCRSIGGRW